MFNTIGKAFGNNAMSVTTSILNPSAGLFEHHHFSFVTKSVLHAASQKEKISFYSDTIHWLFFSLFDDFFYFVAQFFGKALVRIQTNNPFCCDIRIVKSPSELFSIILKFMEIDVCAFSFSNFNCFIGTTTINNNAPFGEAFHFYELAAKQNNVIALNNLGSLYFNGIGTDVDYDTAARLFKKAAELGSDDAAVNLAFIYLSSEKESFVEPAIKLFEQAAQAGNNTAKFMLGYAYHKGIGIEYDPYEAVTLIREAADAGFDEAQYTLANIYIDGEGTAQNYNNAVKYYRKAIAQGHVESMVDLAAILAEGKIFPKNLIQAHILCNIASVYGIAKAAKNRDTIESALKLVELLEAHNAAEQYH